MDTWLVIMQAASTQNMVPCANPVSAPFSCSVTLKINLQESATSYGEVDCVAKVLPAPLSEMSAFTRSFFPEFGDTRGMHNGAEFHATHALARPELANDTVLTGRTAHYTKGPALLHMLESYMDANIRKVRDRRHETWQRKAATAFRSSPC